MSLLGHYRREAQHECSPRRLFGSRPTLRFCSERLDCPDCRQSLRVQKTRTKTIQSLALGRFTAHETLLECRNPACANNTVHAAESLARLAPPGGSFGYDVLVFAGKALFVRHRCVEETVDELLARGVTVSASEVAWLAKRFLVCLALAHRRAAPRVKEAMYGKGGYILHLDGTYDKGGPMLISGIDSISGIVLGNVKAPSEKTGEIAPFLEAIKERYGIPLACNHDMGTGILAAVKEVFPGTPDFICHFHFLRDLGKDLLEEDYTAIRRRLRKHGLTEKLRARARSLKTEIDRLPGLCASFHQVLQPCAAPVPKEHLERFPLFCAYTLICWALAGKDRADGYGFPFDRPQLELASRLLAVHELLGQIRQAPMRGERRRNRPLCKLFEILAPLGGDHVLKKNIGTIREKIEVFDQLRDAMRMAPAGAKAGLNSGDEPETMGPIQRAVTAFRAKIAARGDCRPGSPWQKMIDQLDKYWEKLFADPIKVMIAGNPARIQPQRTNNLMERFFRDFRRGARRRSGRNRIGKFLQTMIADTPLIKNLDRPDYVKILLDGHADLETCFAQLEIEVIRRETKLAQSQDQRIPPEIKKLLDDPALPDLINSLFEKAA